MRPRLTNFSQFLRNWVKDFTRSDHRRRSVQLELEILEDRSTPSANASGLVEGVAFIDAAAIGIYRSTDELLPGVSVTLTGTTSQGTAVNVSANTDSNGAYTFSNVLPGSYQVSAGAVDGLLGNGAPEATGPAFSVSGGQTVTLNIGYHGLGPPVVSVRQFLTNTSAVDFVFGDNTPGDGQGLANYRPNSDPTISKAIADQSVQINSAATSIDLAGRFTDPDITNSQVTFNITNGTHPTSLNVTLLDTIAPQTVANFLDYVKAGDYNDAVFSRLVSGFVLQGGGAKLNATNTGLVAVTPKPAVPNEFGTPNTKATLAMALSAGDINSGTDQFFFNLVDNSTSLNPQKFTVFGELTDPASQATLANLATTTVKNESTSTAATALPTVDLSNIPLTNYSGTHFPTDATKSNYMVINSVTIDKQDEFLIYSATSSNTNLVTASISNEWLTLHYIAGQTGTATITVRAVDRYGAAVEESFKVTVNPSAPSVSAVKIIPDNINNVTLLTAAPTGTDPQNNPITYHYQWQKNGANISGATTNTLTLSTAGLAVNDKLTVKVTPSDGQITGATFTSNVITIKTVSPITIVPPSIAGVTIAPNSATSATTLTATSLANPDPLGQAVTGNFLWTHNGSPVPGATTNTLTLSTVALSVGDQLGVQVIPTDGTLIGANFTSNVLKVKTVSPTTFQLPSITSVTIAADNKNNATVLNASVTSPDPAFFSYQWFKNGTAISGATSASFALTPQSAKLNDTFDVSVTPVEGPLTGPAVTSNNITITGTNPFTTP